MKRLVQGLATAAWLALAALGLASSASAQPPISVAATPDEAHQVLVLLRVAPDHFRPNSDYADAYGAGPGQGARQRIAARLAKDYGLKASSAWPMPLLGLDCIVFDAPKDAAPAEVAQRLSRDPQVAWAEPMSLYHGQAGGLTHNDPLFRVQPAATEWRLAELHGYATGKGVKVAVIDSAVDAGHPDLAGQVAQREDFVQGHPAAAESHGTGVAGVIAAVADNHLGIAGVAPHARLMALRACWQRAPDGATTCDTLSLAKALYFAMTHGAEVINLSLSGPPDPLLSELLKAALDRHVAVVGAVDAHAPGGGFPASQPGVVAVASEDAPFGGAFAAPGRDVPTTQPGGRWAMVQGSSYAAAHVSGLIALVREKSQARPAQALLVRASGGGRIDACATLARAGPCECACERAAN
jgi:subtilisin family serine protease